MSLKMLIIEKRLYYINFFIYCFFSSFVIESPSVTFLYSNSLFKSTFFVFYNCLTITIANSALLLFDILLLSNKTICYMSVCSRAHNMIYTYCFIYLFFKSVKERKNTHFYCLL